MFLLCIERRKPGPVPPSTPAQAKTTESKVTPTPGTKPPVTKPTPPEGNTIAMFVLLNMQITSHPLINVFLVLASHRKTPLIMIV